MNLLRLLKMSNINRYTIVIYRKKKDFLTDDGVFEECRQ